MNLRRLSIIAIFAVFGVCYTGTNAQDLSRGHQTLIDRGLQLQALAFPQDTGYFDPVRWAESNFTTIQFHSAGYDTSGYLASVPGMLWSRTRLGDYTIPVTDVHPSEYPYVSNLVAFQVQDEQDMTDPTNVAYMKLAVESFGIKYPNVIVHTNQSGGQHTIAQMQTYMQQVQPGMLMFDTYPFNGSVAGGSPTNFYRDMMKYRNLGLLGNDGTETQPIPTGLYTQTMIWSGTNNHVVSESEIRLNNFSAWAFGYKLISSFIYDNVQSDPGVLPALFTGNGTTNPTQQFYQVAETNRQSRNLGPALVRLLSSDVRMKMGQHKIWIFTVDNTLPSGVSGWDSSADPYITNITATNSGSKNDGLRGDVIVGYFKPLAPEFTNPGHEEDIYFMIVNGLSDAGGSAADSAQQIRLDFNFGASGIDSLLRLSRDNGLVEEVALIHDGGSLYHLNLILDGGTGDLFKFNNGGAFVPEPATIGLLAIGCSLAAFGRGRK